jgi:hypothetical protein
MVNFLLLLREVCDYSLILDEVIDAVEWIQQVHIQSAIYSISQLHISTRAEFVILLANSSIAQFWYIHYLCIHLLLKSILSFFDIISNYLFCSSVLFSQTFSVFCFFLIEQLDPILISKTVKTFVLINLLY